MNRPMRVLLPLLIALAAGVPAFAQNADWNEWKKLNDEAVSLYRQGQYDRGIVVAKKALDYVETAKGPDHQAVATPGSLGP